MSNTTKRWDKRFCWILLLAATSGRAQSSAPAETSEMVARLVPGKSMQYEFEGVVHISAVRGRDVKLNIPDECSFRLRAVIDLRPEHTSAAGAVTGHVDFRGVRYDGPTCSIPAKTSLAMALRKLEKDGTEFEVNPAGDVHIRNTDAAQCEGVSVLLRAAWDLVQVRLSDQKISPRSAPFPSRRFLYWPDTFVDGMEVAAASMRYERDAVIARQPYAWLEYKQVFAPADMPAYVETRSRARDFTGTTYVTGRATVSLLFDRSAGRIVFLHREREIDNRMTVKYDPTNEAMPLATYAIEEDSSVRWLPSKNSEAWLSELHKFETQPAGSKAIRSEKATTTQGRKELSELLERTPAGFERWGKSYCSNGYCFELSLAVPEQTRIAENADATALLLSGVAAKTVTVAVGPMLDQQYQNLDDEELLRQQSQRFVANYLWFAGREGHPLNFDLTAVQDRPAVFSDFTAVARDLKPIRGRLVMVIGPFNRLVPVACSYASTEQTLLDPVCQTVTNSVLLH
ncbi:MAG TPA: hypothetical protein VKB77_12520 [Terriglobales bacterium]|nr:hypothetical protein [Terriglobales bacterium]